MNWLRTALAGLIIGTGAAAPGISGGSIAVATGIYEQFFAALGGIKRQFGKSIRFLLPLAVGGAAGAACFVFGISYLLARWPTATAYAFFGLMVGTFPSVRRRCDKQGFKWAYLIPFISAIAATVAAFVLLDDRLGNLQLTAPTMALCGVIYGLGTIIPGVSSSLILMSMEVYRPILQAITAGDLATLWPMIAGAALTVLLLIGLINRLFERAYSVASYTFFGLLVGSTAVMLPPLPRTPDEIIACITVASAACTAAYLFTGHFEKD